MHVTHEPPSGTGHFLCPRPARDRPFECIFPACDCRFHRGFTLHEHIKTHTGERPHSCPVEGCGKRFITSGNLARHRKYRWQLNAPWSHATQCGDKSEGRARRRAPAPNHVFKTLSFAEH
ncbi:hypothetical protein PsorP6_000942 [Peronosclerospora sorghi]|uniref:Uncharacterized protein n=1 Tax=Peronosclerospora sorghi TaxID=230839 RepID=A0ACC0WSZ7_9STRA|nr:hypothetical protein PsorP6_000942 [Peronosclerospora sorghi]